MKESTSRWLRKPLLAATGILGALALAAPSMAARPIVHDGEYYFLEAQYKDAWEKENKEIDARLAETGSFSRRARRRTGTAGRRAVTRPISACWSTT